MTAKSATIETEQEAQFDDILKEAQKEFQNLRRISRQLDPRYKRASAAIRKNMEEIQKNIDYAKAGR